MPRDGIWNVICLSGIRLILIASRNDLLYLTAKVAYIDSRPPTSLIFESAFLCSLNALPSNKDPNSHADGMHPVVVTVELSLVVV